MLINPKMDLIDFSKSDIEPPLSLMAISAVLENDHNVSILDANLFRMDSDGVRREIERVRPDIIGTTARTPKKYYSIHGLVKFTVDVRDKKPFLRLFSHLDMEYDHFEVEPFDDPDITFTIGDFTPDLSDCKVIDHTYYIRKGYIYYKQSVKIAKWESEISGFEGGVVKVRIKSNYPGYWFFVGYVVEAIINFTLLRKGACFIHASAMEKDGKAYIFPGRSGIGKTTFCLYMMDKGYRFISDDLVILKDHDAYSYPIWLHIFSYHLKTVPTYNEHLSSKRKAEVFLKYILHKASFGYAKIFTFMKFGELFPKVNIADSAKIEKAIFLIGSNGGMHSKADLDKSNSVNRLVHIMRIEFNTFRDVIDSYGVVFPESQFARQFDAMKDLLNASWNFPTKVISLGFIDKEAVDFLEGELGG